MKEDVFNTSIRKLLKEFGVTAQREIERAVRQAVAEQQLNGGREVAHKADIVDPCGWSDS
jgi:Family of unknown function (DUF6494)